MAIMPGASREQKFSGNRHKAPIDKLVIHTTEGSNWPGYNGGKSAPHFTTNRHDSIRQHIDTAYSAKALENRSGGVETNNDGVIQVECIGSCDRAWAKKHGLFFWPDADDADLMGLARIMAWAHLTHGIPLTTRNLKFVDTNIAYPTAPERMTFEEWRRFSGICGHQHVPENSHWDPGKMNVQRAIDLAKKIVNNTITVEKPKAEKVKTTKAPAFPLPRKSGQMFYYGQASGPIASVSGKGRNSIVPSDVVKDSNGRWYSKGLKLWQARMKARGWNITVDGRFGDQTEKIVRQFQKLIGETVDGKLGPATFKAAWEHPVT